MEQQATNKIDGNSLDSIIRLLGVADFYYESYVDFDKLRKHCSDYKVLGIVGSTPLTMKFEFIWVYKICDSPSEAIEIAKNNNLDPKDREHNLRRVVYCAYDKQGNYIGGLESI